MENLWSIFENNDKKDLINISLNRRTLFLDEMVLKLIV